MFILVLLKIIYLQQASEVLDSICLITKSPRGPVSPKLELYVTKPRPGRRVQVSEWWSPVAAHVQRELSLQDNIVLSQADAAQDNVLTTCIENWGCLQEASARLMKPQP